MAYSSIDPPAAHALLTENEDHVYIDVRTVEEFEAGHPEGAYNLPVFERSSDGRMAPNGDFEALLKASFSGDKALIMGCAAGRRSMAACQLAEQLGYDRVYNVEGGYGGARDALGTLIQPGWRDADLPISTQADSRSYAELKGAQP